MFFPDIKIAGASYPSVPSVMLPDAFMDGVYNNYAFIDDSEPLDITENGTHDVTNYAQVNVNVQGGGGGGLPTGISKLAFGTYTFESDMTGNSSTTSATYQKTITHNLGVVPDMILFYSPTAIDLTYSMLGMLWGSYWRGSTYPTNVWYHGNSTTTVSGTSCSATYGIRNVTATQFSLKTYSNSSSYFWRAGTYKWVAIKFS